MGASPSIYTAPGTSGLLALSIQMTERSSEGLDVRRRRLLFRAWRRGVRETDLIVGRFADAYIDKFDTSALDDFERLIEVPNAELYAWVAGDESVPQDFDTAVLRQLIDFHRQGAAKQGEVKR
jgi:antitoxin CptB